MFTREEKRRAFLNAMSGFMERFAPEIETGMTDLRLEECLAWKMSMQVIWGGPGRFSGSCKPERLQIFAAPTPLHRERLILDRAEVMAMARAEYEIPDPDARQLQLF